MPGISAVLQTLLAQRKEWLAGVGSLSAFLQQTAQSVLQLEFSR